MVLFHESELLPLIFCRGLNARLNQGIDASASVHVFRSRRLSQPARTTFLLIYRQPIENSSPWIYTAEAAMNGDGRHMIYPMTIAYLQPLLGFG